MAFEWDRDKAETNRRKHGVDFADAVGVFEDPRAFTQEDPFPDEERFASLGLDSLAVFFSSSGLGAATTFV